MPKISMSVVLSVPSACHTLFSLTVLWMKSHFLTIISIQGGSRDVPLLVPCFFFFIFLQFVAAICQTNGLTPLWKILDPPLISKWKIDFDRKSPGPKDGMFPVFFANLVKISPVHANFNIVICIFTSNVTRICKNNQILKFRISRVFHEAFLILFSQKASVDGTRAEF